MWNTYRTTKEFPQGRPWLLRFFDQLRFYPVSADELLEMRRMFPLGRVTLPIEETTFRLRDYQQFLSGIADSTTAFRETQRGAFAAERQRWAEQGEFSAVEEPDAESTSSSSDVPIPPGCVAVRSPATASVWQLHVERGQNLQAGERALILEAMKMEIVVAVPQSGEVVEVLCQSGTLVSAGQPLLVYRPQT
jgi:urea carboxylase